MGNQKPKRPPRASQPVKKQTYLIPVACSLSYYLLWIALHYTAANLYVYFCTPTTLYGALTSPFLVATPHCSALRWVISEGSNTVLAMWSVAGIWCITRLTQRLS